MMMMTKGTPLVSTSRRSNRKWIIWRLLNKHSGEATLCLLTGVKHNPPKILYCPWSSPGKHHRRRIKTEAYFCAEMSSPLLFFSLVMFRFCICFGLGGAESSACREVLSYGECLTSQAQHSQTLERHPQSRCNKGFTVWVSVALEFISNTTRHLIYLCLLLLPHPHCIANQMMWQGERKIKAYIGGKSRTSQG